MRLPWRNRREDKSGEALKDARKNLRAVERRSGEVTQVADELKHFRETNHFAQQLEEALFRYRSAS